MLLVPEQYLRKEGLKKTSSGYTLILRAVFSSVLPEKSEKVGYKIIFVAIFRVKNGTHSVG